MQNAAVRRHPTAAALRALRALAGEAEYARAPRYAARHRLLAPVRLGLRSPSSRSLSTFVFAPYFATAVAGRSGARPGAVGLRHRRRRARARIPVAGARQHRRRDRRRRSRGSPPRGGADRSPAFGLWFATPGAQLGVICWTLAAYAVATVGDRGRDGVQQRHDARPRAAGAPRPALGHRLGGRLCRRPRLARARARVPRGDPGDRPDLPRPRAALRARSRARARATASPGRSPPSGSSYSCCRSSLFTPDVPRTGAKWASTRRARGPRQARGHGRGGAPASARRCASFSPTWSTRTGSWRSSPSAASTARACSAGAPVELGVFGILLTVTGTIGACRRRASRRPPRREARRPRRDRDPDGLCAGILSLGREHVLFVFPAEPPRPGDGLFASLPEKLFLALRLVIGAVAGPLQASSRSLLARIAPAERPGAISGCSRSREGSPPSSRRSSSRSRPRPRGTQAAGLAVLVVFFAAGGWLLRGVVNAGSGGGR